MAASVPAIGDVLGHYRLLEEVGSGGMGVVFRARDQHLPRDVALKILHPNSFQDSQRRDLFRNEARTLSKLIHPNIAHIYDFDNHGGVDFLAMEFVKGTTLSAALNHGPMPEPQVISLGEQIASTLADAHRSGIIHCDIKPGNIMLTPDGHVKLLDFGLAQLLRTSETSSTISLAEPPAFAGTLPYMAPEQLRGEPSDFKSDIYALGVSLYELATGRKPFDNPLQRELRNDIQHKPPEPPRNFAPSLSPQLQKIILTCLEKDPALRLYTAGELSKTLSLLRTGEQAKPRPWWLDRFLIPALVLSLAVAAVAYWWSHPRPQPPDLTSSTRLLAIFSVSAPGSSAETVAFDGLISTLTSRLAKLSSSHHLQVIPATEIRAKKVTTLQEASVQFGVGLGLELSIERANDMVRVNYALVDARSHQQLNGGTVTASASDFFALEDKVADSVVQTLNLQLQPQERKSLTNSETAQPVAYDYYLQGVGYLQDFHKPENVESAITVFNHAVELDPNYALAFAGLGQAFYYKHVLSRQNSWMGQAKEACDHAVQLRPDRAAGHYCLGLVLGGYGKNDAAAEQLKKATDLDPSDDRIYAALASAYARAGKPEAAEATFRHAISLRPNDWVAYNSLGSFYLSHGRYPDAAAQFTQIIALAPDSYAGYSNLGSTYLQQGDYARAIPLLDHSVDIRATEQNTSNLATAYFAQRQFTQAARTYEKALTLNQNSYEIWGNLGDAYYWAPGERARSREAYQKAIALGNPLLTVNPNNSQVLAYLAQDYVMSGQRTEASAYIQQALKLNPKDPDTLKTAALVFNQLGDNRKACSYLKQALAAGATLSDLHNTPNFDNLWAFPELKKLSGPW